jgi:hypothetical protein
VLDRGYLDFRERYTGEVRTIPLLGTWVNRARRRATVGTMVWLRLEAEAGSNLGDELVVPAHPVALAELNSAL